MRLLLKISHCVKLFPFIILISCASVPREPGQWYIEPVSLYDSGHDQGTEIISVQQSSLRAVLSNFDTGEVDLLDVSKPQKIKRMARFSLGLSQGESLTSVAFHPSADLFANVVDAGTQRGRLEIRSAPTGVLIDKIEVGYGPDAVVFSQDGNLVLIANEGEDYSFNRQTREFFSAEGSISIVHLDQSGQVKANNNLAMADVKYREGFVVQEHGHFLEREVDWDGDGKISNTQDFDGNGIIENKKIKLGSFEGADVFGTETKGERKILIPIQSHSKALLEPEYIAISPDARRAYVTLQETNEVAEVDIVNERVLGYFSMGVTEHSVDAHNDGWVQFKDRIKALREPDGIAITADGRYFITADEGDTDTERDASDSAEPFLSGGRTVSVFDAETGKLVGDTGNQLDEISFAHGLYPDSRSETKGAEPEMLTAFEMDGRPWVAVGMERSGAVILISLTDPAHPKAVALGKIPGDEAKSPEGIAHFIVAGEHFLITANEMDGTVACFKVSNKAALPALNDVVYDL